ncbi:MAG: PhoX family protein [Gammaproteobacteria bacterium]|nr:PhoX family protein [Gammaproteobacteria bacterium]
MKKNPVEQRSTLDLSSFSLNRRQTLRYGIATLGLAVGSPLLSGCSDGSDTRSRILQAPDENGVALPMGYTSRIVARSSQPVAGTSFVWHNAPDGGACFDAGDGGWIYVSNSEQFIEGGGGVSAIRFDANGTIVNAYNILSDTTANCAGGKTPWNTWLSCEEKFIGDGLGLVYECDPFGVNPAVARPAMGAFAHEAVAVDDVMQTLYLTEDRPDGKLYRFTPTNYPDLSSGLLEVAQVIGDPTTGASLTWHTVPDPSGLSGDTRYQVPESSDFNGGEGIAFGDGIIYFATKGDNRIWRFDTIGNVLDILYDDDGFTDPVLTGVDNITIAPSGEIYVAEDGGNMQLVALTQSGEPFPIAQVVGQEDSEITGPAVYGNRLYFSSQRGTGPFSGEDGITYEITGFFG